MSVYRFLQALPVKLREEDKVKHIVCSFALTAAALCLTNAWLAAAAAFIVGLGKELWDLRYGTGFCLFDIAGNCLGIGMALMLAWLLLA